MPGTYNNGLVTIHIIPIGRLIDERHPAGIEPHSHQRHQHLAYKAGYITFMGEITKSKNFSAFTTHGLCLPWPHNPAMNNDNSEVCRLEQIFPRQRLTEAHHHCQTMRQVDSMQRPPVQHGAESASLCRSEPQSFAPDILTFHTKIYAEVLVHPI